MHIFETSDLSKEAVGTLIYLTLASLDASAQLFIAVYSSTSCVELCQVSYFAYILICCPVVNIPH